MKSTEIRLINTLEYVLHNNCTIDIRYAVAKHNLNTFTTQNMYKLEYI